jgi:hypothetical protein
MLYLNNGQTISLTNLESTLPMVCLHATQPIYDMVQRFSLSGHPLLILGIYTGTGRLVPDCIGARRLGPATLEALQGASTDMSAYLTIQIFVREIGLQLNC